MEAPMLVKGAVFEINGARIPIFYESGIERGGEDAAMYPQLLSSLEVPI